ncbi:PLP-dependent aminotransferase family protein [Nocardia aobensis]|uniref:PLP-dependent aminotransferase family protein n=1 Tax=Nocardia aobensis TaxID=257277 RepID=A0ABW6NV63_9NOCA
MDELPLAVDRSDRRPLSVQVADELRNAATDGRLRGGDRMPSSRALAARLGVSRTVVTAAYDQLHAEGWISGRHGSGTYLTAAPVPASNHSAAQADSDSAGELLDLAPGAPCAEAMDSAAWRRAWRAAGDRGPSVRKERAGDPGYRAMVAEHLLRHRGLRVDQPARIIATAGTSSAVAEFARAVLRPGDAVAIEDPGYLRAVGAFRSAGVEVVPVPMDRDGILVESIPAHVRAVYCTPAHQFPLGVRMPAGRRVELVDFARRTGAVIIEDDYDGELRYDSAPLPLLAGLAPDLVVHLGTTSKILSPTLGVGWLVAAPWIVAAVLEHRESTGAWPAPAGQLVLAELARHGDLARHLRRLRREVPPRRTLTVAELGRHGLDIRGDDAGSHLVVPLPDATAESRAIELARRRGVLLDGLARHHAGPRQAFGIALGYTAVPRDELPRALRIAAECLAAAAHGANTDVRATFQGWQ